MKKRFISTLALIIAIVILSAIPLTVHAETTTLGSDSRHNETYDLSKGDVIAWDWEVVGEGDIDFWVEDDNGVRYNTLEDAEQSDGRFTVPRDGGWTVQLHNNNSEPVILDYEIEIEYEDDFRDFLSSMIWLFLIFGVIIIILVIIFIAALIKERKELTDSHELPEDELPPLR